MKIKTFLVGAYAVNCAVVWGKSKKALVIDPGCDAGCIETILQNNSLTVEAYLLTHGHADHISALAELHAAHPAPVYIHKEDYKWAFTSINQIAPYYGVPEKPDAEFIHPESAERWTLAGLSFQCIETPGHTRGGVCYWFESEHTLFSGDTLFKGTCGRTDLPGGSARTLSQSLKKLAQLPGETIVYPGHNSATTIQQEKNSNFFMQQAV